jgi:hypothetical protein
MTLADHRHVGGAGVSRTDTTCGPRADETCPDGAALESPARQGWESGVDEDAKLQRSVTELRPVGPCSPWIVARPRPMPGLSSWAPLGPIPMIVNSPGVPLQARCCSHMHRHPTTDQRPHPVMGLHAPGVASLRPPHRISTSSPACHGCVSRADAEPALDAS